MSATKDALVALRGGSAQPTVHAAEGYPVNEAAMRSFLTSYVDNHNLPEGGAALGISLRALKSEFGTFDTTLAAQLVRELTARAAPATVRYAA